MGIMYLKVRDVLKAMEEVFLNFFTISLISLTLILLAILYL